MRAAPARRLSRRRAQTRREEGSALQLGCRRPPIPLPSCAARRPPCATRRHFPHATRHPPLPTPPPWSAPGAAGAACAPRPLLEGLSSAAGAGAGARAASADSARGAAPPAGFGADLATSEEARRDAARRSMARGKGNRRAPGHHCTSFRVGFPLFDVDILWRGVAWPACLLALRCAAGMTMARRRPEAAEGGTETIALRGAPFARGAAGGARQAEAHRAH